MEKNKRRWESERWGKFSSRKKERNEMEGRCLWDGEKRREKREREESERGLPWDNNTQKYWEHGNAAVLWIGPAGVKGGVLPLGCRD